MYIIIILSCCSALHWNETKRNRRYGTRLSTYWRHEECHLKKISLWFTVGQQSHFIHAILPLGVVVFISYGVVPNSQSLLRSQDIDTPLCRTLGKPPAWLLFVNLKTHTRTHSRDTILTHIYTAREMMRGKIQYNTGASERAVARSYLTSVVRTLLLRPR